MRRIVVAKMIGLLLFGLYLAIGLTKPTGGQNRPRLSLGEHLRGSTTGNTF
jgi:hypothetical protein